MPIFDSKIIKTLIINIHKNYIFFYKQKNQSTLAKKRIKYLKQNENN